MAFFQCGNVRIMMSTPESGNNDRFASVLYFKVADIQATAAAMKEKGVGG